MNKDFLTGFAIGAQISDPIQLSLAYRAWCASTGLNEVELIDLEGGGYETGLEVGSKLFRAQQTLNKLFREQQQPNN